MQDYVQRSIRVYLVDDHDIVRRGLRDLLAVKRDITVVGDSGSARGSAERILSLKPDVMVLDLHLQDGSGIEVCREVRSVDPSIKALLLTSAADDEALLSAVVAGAAGYATKLIASDSILDAIRKVGAGRSLIDEAAAERAGQQLMADLESSPSGLSPRDRDVFRHLLAGQTNREIADDLAIEVKEATVVIAAVLQVITGRLGTQPAAPG